MERDSVQKHKERFLQMPADSCLQKWAEEKIERDQNRRAVVFCFFRGLNVLSEDGTSSKLDFENNAESIENIFNVLCYQLK